MSKTTLLLSIVLIVSGCGADSEPVKAPPGIAPVQTIEQSYRVAIEVRDFDAVMALVCWDGVEAEMEEMYRRRLERTAERAIISVAREPASFKEAVTYKRNGKTYGHNLTLTGWLVVKYAGEGVVESYIPLGEKDGRTMITMAAPR